MKRNIIGYREPNNVIEVAASVDEKKLKEFFKSIDDYDFFNGYVDGISSEAEFRNNGDARGIDIEIVDTRNSYVNNTLQTSDDVKYTLKALSEQGVMNFKPLTELLMSNSKMNNPTTIRILKQFIDLYDFERKCFYETGKFASIHRAILTIGNEQDIKDFDALASSLDDNTLFLNFIGKTTLLREEEKPKTL